MIATTDVVDAIKTIDAAMSTLSDPDDVPHYEVQKAIVLRGAGRIMDAARLLARVSTVHGAADSVHFFAGQYALELREYSVAVTHLSRCIGQCRETSDFWYLDSAYLLRAYCHAKLGQRQTGKERSGVRPG